MWLRSLAAINVSLAGEMSLRKKKNNPPHNTTWDHLSFRLCRSTAERGLCVSGHWPDVPAVALELVSERELSLARQAASLPGNASEVAAVCAERSTGRYHCGGDEVTSGYAFREKRSLLLGNGSASWLDSLTAVSLTPHG